MLIKVFQLRWKILVLSLVAQFLISALVHLGVRTPAALSFLSLSSIKIQTSVLGSTLSPSGR